MSIDTSAIAEEPKLFRLDLGGGKRPLKDYLNVDVLAFEGVDIVADLRQPWPWIDNSVDAINASHFIEHFDAAERIHIMNEAWRVLKPDAPLTFVVPHWCSCRAYGDLTHKWPPVSEFFFLYLNKKWRMDQAPHTDASNWPSGYTCDFEYTFGYNLNEPLGVKDDNYRNYAVANYKEAVSDIQGTLKKIALSQ
jgi:SAM-dependent methyltransferase